MRLTSNSQAVKPQATKNTIDLANFAAVCGLTETEFSERMFYKLQNCDILNLLKPAAQKDLYDWFLKNEDRPFVIAFRLSVNKFKNNKLKDDALYCFCQKNQEGDIYVKDAIRAFIGEEPEQTRGMETFEICLCDLETAI